MSEPNPKDEKHPTAATASKPEEEFIAPKGRPSKDVSEVVQEVPPKQADEK